MLQMFVLALSLYNTWNRGVFLLCKITNLLIYSIKADIPDNAKPVCNDAEFKGITEMSIDIHLLDGRISGGVGRHGAVGSFIRVEGIIQPVGFFEGFQLPDDTVRIFGVVFRNPGLNTGGIKKEHGSLCVINLLADWFGQVNEPVKHRL